METLKFMKGVLELTFMAIGGIACLVSIPIVTAAVVIKSMED